MTNILLTGGSGFIAAHILDQLLAKGHRVVTTVRSEEKAKPIREAYKDKGDRLTVVATGDISREDAFDEVVKTPGLEVVLHTASPFHFNFKTEDAQTALLDPAINGTRGILKAIKKSAPGVKRVVITSSFAAVLDASKLSDPNTTFTEASWNPITMAQATESQALAYRLSKTMAERAAWDFVAKEKPNFDLATVNPPLVFGPVVHHLASLDTINTSNERIVALATGGWNKEIPETGPITIWVDVRDVALAHIRAMENPAAGGKRCLTVGSRFSHRQLAEIAWNNFPELKDKLPPKDVPGGGAPGPTENFKYNNDQTNEVLGIKWRTLEDSITDLIKTLQNHGI